MEPSKLSYGPAQKVGQMRVCKKKANKRNNGGRNSAQQCDNNSGDSNDDVVLSNSEMATDIIADSSTTIEDGEEVQLTETDESNDESAKIDPFQVRELKKRYARDLHAHSASREPDISANLGSNLKQIRRSNPQQRGLSH